MGVCTIVEPRILLVVFGEKLRMVTRREKGDACPGEEGFLLLARGQRVCRIFVSSVCGLSPLPLPIPTPTLPLLLPSHLSPPSFFISSPKSHATQLPRVVFPRRRSVRS